MTITEEAMTSTTARHRLMNGDRELVFDGELIGTASTRTKRESDLHRWTEVHIFRTASGAYVVQRVGRSRVWHDPESPRASGKLVTWHTLDALTDEEFADLVPDTVNPPKKTIDEYDKVRLEVTRSQCSVATKADGVIEALRATDPQGIIFIAKVSKQAIEAAAKVDAAIAEAWNAERVA